MVEARSLSVAQSGQGVRAPERVKGRIAEMGNGSERFLLGWRRISAGLSQILWSAIIGGKFRGFSRDDDFVIKPWMRYTQPWLFVLQDP